ncbi:redox-regulated ATPase YchF [Candidatus Gottesmanbacteria bacterium]|nr:redox-regulated ATPase YchF [Candidatus Gottesmanbacteria bacterium]
MSLKVGIVGLPNAGKSTLFNALLKKQAALAANYPFATIEPNIGIVPVPDERLEKLARVIEQTEHVMPPLVPATVEFVDIAGLVSGASTGEGLGNKFLSHIREVDLICHVTRYFADEDVIHVAGSVDPKRDQGIIETELILADLQTLENQTLKSKNQKDISKSKNDALQKLTEKLNKGISARDTGLSIEEHHAIRDLHLLTLKPELYVSNIGEVQIKDFASSNSTMKQLNNTMLISAKVESELSALSESEQKEYLASLGWDHSGLDRLIQVAYTTLGLISFLTVGVKESRAWTIAKGLKAPQAAGVIHTDFEKKFIRADVCALDDFIGNLGWKGAREVGKVRSEGREYSMNDGDVVEFRIGT